MTQREKIKKIFISPYQLRRKAFSSHSPSHLQTSSKKGVLLKVIFSSGKIGYTSCQTWDELGDGNLDSHITLLKKGELTPFMKNSLRLASFYGTSFWKDIFKKNKIQNHHFVTDLSSFVQRGEKTVKVLVDQGFQSLKIKLTPRHLKKQTKLLKNLSSFLPSSLLFRLDCNHSFNEREFTNWIEKNESWLVPHLDFIEDPFFYQPKAWSSLSQNFHVSLSLDREGFKTSSKCDNKNSEWGKGIDVFVIKPTLKDPKVFLNRCKNLPQYQKGSLKFVFTHNMDHVLGQLFSLMEAKRHKKDLKHKLHHCGLLSLKFYENLPFALKGRGKKKTYIDLNSYHEKKIDFYLKNQIWKLLKRDL